MNQLENAKKVYNEIPIPSALDDRVNQSLYGLPRQKKIFSRVILCAAASLCIVFVVLLNCSHAFAQTVSTIPVIGDVARVFTFTQYKIEDDTRKIDVKEPVVSNTGHAALEERINREINEKVKNAIAEAEEQTAADKKAFVETGGNPNDFIPAIVDVNYEIKCSNEKVLSFVLNTTRTQANAFTDQTFYNIDLKSGRVLTLTDLLGKDYKKVVDESVSRQIKERVEKDPNQMFFTGSEGFSGIKENQKFYINSAGNVVIVFAKYEIAPGVMGIPEFEITDTGK